MSVKKEYRIDSSDSARPAASMDDQPYQTLQMGYKPEEHALVDIIYDETDEVISTRTGDQVQVVVRTKIFDNGDTAVSAIGANNAEYKEFLRTGVALPAKQIKSKAPTGRDQSDKVKAALEKLNKPAAKKSTKKEA